MWGPSVPGMLAGPEFIRKHCLVPAVVTALFAGETAKLAKRKAEILNAF